MRHLAPLLLGLICAVAQPGALLAADPIRTTTVAKVRAYQSHGKINSGSAVLLDGERLATNCHVTAEAQEIELVQAGRVLRAELAAQDLARDLCLLRVRGVTGVPAVMAKPAAAGQHIYAAGFFRRDRFAVTAGQIVALHDYDGAKVIQVSAGFDFGASGGGLFDERGQLIGILTFKARAGGPYHFAIPAQWIVELLQAGATRDAQPVRAFWQQPPEKQPFFLRAATLEVNREWHALAALSEQWVQKNPSDAGAWTTRQIALRHLAREGDAEEGARDEAQRLDRRQSVANAVPRGDFGGAATCVGGTAPVELSTLGY